MLYTKKLQDPSDHLQDCPGQPKQIPRNTANNPTEFQTSLWRISSCLAPGLWQVFVDVSPIGNHRSLNLRCADCTASTPLSAGSDHLLPPWGGVHSSSNEKGKRNCLCSCCNIDVKDIQKGSQYKYYEMWHHNTCENVSNQDCLKLINLEDELININEFNK